MYRKFIGFFLNEILERFVRFHNVVEECELELPEDRRHTLTRSLKSEAQAKISDLLRWAQRFYRFTTVDQQTELTTFKVLQEFANDFQKLHQGLLWVSKPWVGEETYSFVEDFFESEKATAFYKRLNGSLAFMHVYNFWSYPVHRHFPGDTSNTQTMVWALPCAEKHNPLMWPIILHEIGHDITWLSNIDVEVFQALPPAFFTTRNRKWVAEISADLLALQLGGPAYLFPLLTLAMFFVRQNLRLPQNDHPSPLSRIEFLIERLHEMGLDSDERKSGQLQIFQNFLDRRLELDQASRNLYFLGEDLKGDEAEVFQRIASEVSNALKSKTIPHNRIQARKLR